MKINNTRSVTIDDMQFYLARGAELHPHTYELYKEELETLSYLRELKNIN